MQDTADSRAFFSRLNARQYEEQLVPRIFRPWAEALLPWLDAPAGGRVLDLACGTGALTRCLHEQRPDLELYGLDLSADMLEIARTCCPAVHWQEGNALNLPWPDDHFDTVCSQQGLQFVPERPAVLHEIRRVLKPGGQLLAACWQPVEENGVYTALLELAEEQGWAGFAGFIRQIFSWPRDALLPAVEQAGLAVEAMDSPCRETRFPSLAGFFHIFSRVPPLQPDWDALDTVTQQRFLAKLEARCAGWCEGGELVFPMCTTLLRARRPQA